MSLLKNNILEISMTMFKKRPMALSNTMPWKTIKRKPIAAYYTHNIKMTNIPLLPIELQFTNIMTVLHFSNQACSHLNM